MPMFITGFAYRASIKDKFFIEPELNVWINTDGRRNVLIQNRPYEF
ncbi:MAG: hypothetical protein R2836_00505 [Chitinophagales bacterium]